MPGFVCPNGAAAPTVEVRPRGVAQGVSAKSSLFLDAAADGYPWNHGELSWQRTGYHFQPAKNWMNDPDAPLYYKGFYHLFYQWNPDSAVWGNITWGHAVSRDLIDWLYLPLAMVPDQWYDINGVWTGSATQLPDGRIVVLYTGSTYDSTQVQNLAVPADLTDPLLLDWVKSESNPVLLPPHGIQPKDFRDPTTAWLNQLDGTWHVLIGSKDEAHAGLALVYETEDFINYELLPNRLHEVAGTGMWECVDFYPVSTAADGQTGLDTSTPLGQGVKHVLKASLDDNKHDYYAIGTYDPADDIWWPDDPELDVGIGLRYDYGKFYASKSFYDPVEQRRILWGWIGETDSESADIQKGWASVQAIPRNVLFDAKTGTNLLQWPIKEVEKLRHDYRTFGVIPLNPGKVAALEVGNATQLDIEAEFEVDPLSLSSVTNDVADVTYNCTTSRGSSGRSALGPFGFLVLADNELVEHTAVYFYITRTADGSGLRTHFCQDESRSSLAYDVVKRIYGSTVAVLDGETLSVRILVDHSIVESFAQGGRTVITSRIYPTEAIYGNARVFIFNNATAATVTVTSLKVWQMNSTHFHPY